jgi:RNA polymerase sigma-70 factor (ECF subfamily)
MHERSDEQLMKSYASGDMAAFEQLYQRYRAPLYRYVVRQVRDDATANDLYQGIWEKVIRARDSFRPSSPFRAWVFRIAHNHIMDYFRRLRPQSELPVESLESEASGPEQRLMEDRRGDRLAEAIARLPPGQRDVLLLKMESALDLGTIARVCGINPETAKSRLRYAVSRLKKRLRDGEEEAGGS